MKRYSISCCDNDAIVKTSNDFIYNRFDLWESGNYEVEKSVWCYSDEKMIIYFQTLCNKQTKAANLGIWLTPINDRVINRIANEVFKKYPYISTIKVENVLSDFWGKSYVNNHFRVILPNSSGELDERLSSKGRYNIRREKRLLREDYKGYNVKCLSARDKDSVRILDKYFEYKRKSKNTEYALTPEEYCIKYHVTDIYVLEVGENNHKAAIILSCEQCPIVYIENMAYDPNLSNYSPGQILYDEYLKMLIQKKKKEVYLGGGDYFYKQRYHSINDKVFKGTIYRNKVINTAHWTDCQARRLYHVLQTKWNNRTKDSIEEK